MITKTVLGVAAAAAIAAGSLGATSTSASAAGVYIGNNGVYVGFGHGHHGKKFCKSIYKKVGWKDKWGRWHARWKVVDYRCSWKPYGGWHGSHW